VVIAENEKAVADVKVGGKKSKKSIGFLNGAGHAEVQGIGES
jgi:hypothetical protein